MRYFNACKALVCALLLSSSVLLGNCSLASYSETRSFRDALDGRSMEDAISGPVDKDTSSYGDRTSGGSQPGSTGVQSPSSMMLTIPANGNLNNMVQQQQQQMRDSDEQQQQQQQSPELERETTPANGAMMTTMDNTEQQVMEQKSAARQRAGSNGRLNSPSPMSGPTKTTRQTQKQPEGDSSTGSTKGGNSESGFGEEQNGNMRPTVMPRQQQQQSQGYGNGRKGGQRSMNGAPSSNDEQQQQQDGANDQQVMNGNGEADQQPQQQQQEQERAYGGANGGDDQQAAAKQKAMAAMLMSMNSGMKYSRGMSPSANNGKGYGDKKQQQQPTSSMAQNMMASLANKAAYMGMQQQKQQQQQQQQRQMAPPPMMVSMIATGSPARSQMGAGNGNYNGMSVNDMASAMAQATGGNGGMRGGMRRANQRKVEKKMSPSMVNAMLNKMLSVKQREQEMGGNGGYSTKPTTVAMLMKSPAGAEMLANMVMPQMSSAMAGMSPAKKEQYKRMMMAAIMQQANSAEDEQPQQQQLDDSYGQQMTSGDNMANGMAPRDAASGAKSTSRGYGAGATNGMMTTTTMSPVAAMMMNMMSAKGKNGYSDEQRARPSMAMNGNGQYADRAMSANGNGGKKGAFSRNGSRQPVMMTTTTMTPGDFDTTQSQQAEQQPEQQQQQSMDGGYTNGDQQQRELPATMGPQTMTQLMSNGAPAKGGARSQMMMNGQVGPAAGGYGQPVMMMQPGMKLNVGIKSAAAGNGNGNNRYAEQKRQMDGNEDDSAADQQQRELSPVTMSPANNMMGPTKSRGNMNGDAGYSSDSMDLMGGQMNGKPSSPMNGFRQAYDQQQQQERIPDNGSTGTRGPTSSPMGGTKSQGDSYPGSTSVPRPMQPMQQSYGMSGASDRDQTQQQQQDEYGAAPMGMAEPFAFDYKVEDDYGNNHYRKEESDKNGVVRGSYGYMDRSGIYRHVEYVADENGFRANVKSNEPGLSSESATSGNGGSGASGNGSRGDDRSSPIGNGSGAGEEDSQQQPPMSPAGSMESGMGAGLSSAVNNPQQQLQQQLMNMMMTPSQTELNENGEK